MKILEYTKADEQEVIDLILNIQQNEFQVPVTIADQPDLKDVANFYKKGLGNFWVAKENHTIIGTIALIDIGNQQAALRKMFVKNEWRGKEKQVGQLLLNHVFDYCLQKNIKEIFLGTFDKLIAAQKFYIRNGFQEIKKEQLPELFPIMQVDNRFFKWNSLPK